MDIERIGFQLKYSDKTAYERSVIIFSNLLFTAFIEAQQIKKVDSFVLLISINVESQKIKGWCHNDGDEYAYCLKREVADLLALDQKRLIKASKNKK